MVEAKKTKKKTKKPAALWYIYVNMTSALRPQSSVTFTGPQNYCTKNGEVESTQTSPRHYLGSLEFKTVTFKATKLRTFKSITLYNSHIIHQPHQHPLSWTEDLPSQYNCSSFQNLFTQFSRTLNLLRIPACLPGPNWNLVPPTGQYENCSPFSI